MNTNETVENSEDEDYIVVLGSGKSINDLSISQRQKINACSVKIALNKYGAFYNKSKIVPTHIFFHDDYDTASKFFLRYIIKYLRKSKIKPLIFIVSSKNRGYFFCKSRLFYFNYVVKSLKINIIRNSVKCLRVLLKPYSLKKFNILKKKIEGANFPIDIKRMALLPRHSKVVYIDVQPWNKRGNKWASKITEPLYHYRGSLTTVFNYISIAFPNRKVLLVGVDFNTSGYFFDEELKRLRFETSDWTTSISREHNMHFSIINYEGTKIDDEMPFMLKNLERSNNKVFSVNKEVYLVKKNFVDYIET